MTEHEQMILSALRYALPKNVGNYGSKFRRSYIMSCTDEYITKMLQGKVSEAFKDNCIRDIEDEYKDRDKFGSTLQYDWIPLKERLTTN